MIASGLRPRSKSKLERRSTLLAIASGGGHWEQLMLLRDAMLHFDVIYASTPSIGASSRAEQSVIAVMDFNAHQPLRLILGSLQIAILLLRVRPSAIISTGAAPGLIALLFGRLLGAHTIWIDSIANARQLSLSGRLARPVAKLWLTQWQHLAQPHGPFYKGSVL